MKKLFLAALLAGATAAEAAPTPGLPAQTTPAAQPSPDQARPAVSKAELKRRRKLRKQNGPVVYKGRIAEESEFLTDDDGSGKEGKPAKTKRKAARAKQ